MKGSFTLALHVTALRDAALRYKNTKSVFMSAVQQRAAPLCVNATIEIHGVTSAA